MSVQNRPRAKGFDAQNINILLSLKDGKEEIWSYESNFNGRTYFHIRGVYKDEHEAFRPGKGFSVPMDRKDELCQQLCLLAHTKEG